MRRGIWLVLGSVVVAVAASGLTYWYTRLGTAPALEITESVVPIHYQVATAEPVERTFTQRVPWTGFVQSHATVELTAFVGGRVEAIEAADEAPVAAGAPVLTLGGPLLAAQQARLQANVESLEAQLALAGQTIERLQQNVAQKLATRNELTAAQAERLKLQGQLREAQLELQSWGAQTRMTAPIAGVFTSRRVNVGQTVKAGDVLGTIVDPNHLRVVASLFAPARTLLAGKEASVRLTARRIVPGVVRRVVPEAAGTGATMIWIEGPHIDSQLHPGQTVAGALTMEARSSLAVPEAAVVYDAREQPYVFVAQQGRYERRGVRVGLTENGWVEILSGLQQGQAVVTAGAYEIANSEFRRQFQVED